MPKPYALPFAPRAVQHALHDFEFIIERHAAVALGISLVLQQQQPAISSGAAMAMATIRAVVRFLGIQRAMGAWSQWLATLTMANAPPAFLHGGLRLHSAIR